MICFFSSCNGQNKNADSCKFYQKKARSKLNDYYKNNDKSLLKEALTEAEQALKCSKNIETIELKLSLLALLKDYKSGYEYTKMLTDRDFKYKYKKEMNYYYFLSMDYATKGDTLNRNKFLNKTVQGIQSYLDKENIRNNKLNEEAYYDLFSFKKMLMNKQKIDIEIDKIEKKYPYNNEFFKALKSSIEEDTRTAKSID